MNILAPNMWALHKIEIFSKTAVMILIIFQQFMKNIFLNEMCTSHLQEDNCTFSVRVRYVKRVLSDFSVGENIRIVFRSLVSSLGVPDINGRMYRITRSADSLSRLAAKPSAPLLDHWFCNI